MYLNKLFLINKIPNNILAYFLVFNFFFIQSQSNKKDSLFTVLKTSKEDKNKINTLNELSREFKFKNTDTAMFLSNEALLLAQKIDWQEGIGKSYHQIASFYYDKSNFNSSLIYYLKALDIWDKLEKIQVNSKKLILKYKSATIGNIGIIYYEEGNYPKALDYYFKALKMAEQLGNKKGEAADLVNIGNLYVDEGLYSNALTYFLKALKIDEESGDKDAITGDLGNIGQVYSGTNQYDKAMHYYFKALKIATELGNETYMAAWYGNIGNVYYLKAKNTGIEAIYRDNFYTSALEYYFKTLKIAKKLDLKSEIVNVEIQIGSLKLEQSYFSFSEEKSKLSNEANLFLQDALVKAKEIGDLKNIRESCLKLSTLCINKKQWKDGLEYYQQYISAKDKINSEENIKKQTQVEMQYDFDKRLTTDSVTNAQKRIQEQYKFDQEIKQQRIYSYGGIIGFLLMIIVAAISYRAYKQKHKANNIITQQKLIVEVKQKEIVDSITYAKRLQLAILPSSDELKKNLSEFFLLYKPKDIVAGDFYWMEQMGSMTYIAAADSTGHGVPGAIVSVVCSNALNRAVKEFGLREPGKILDKTRELVLETFAKSSSEVKDGMDISLLSIDKTKHQIFWSGANNPLWYISNNKLIELTANKQSIGKTDNPQPFTTHTVEFRNGDLFYLMTDGYADQFGGPKGKKYKYKQLEENLLANCKLSLDEQKEILSNSFNNWIGDLEQVDDITIIGIKI